MDRNQLLLDTIETLEHVGCQFFACDGPTLEPVDMATCHVCALLARVRVEVGQPPRRATRPDCHAAGQYPAQ